MFFLVVGGWVWLYIGIGHLRFHFAAFDILQPSRLAPLILRYRGRVEMEMVMRKIDKLTNQRLKVYYLILSASDRTGAVTLKAGRAKDVIFKQEIAQALNMRAVHGTLGYKN